MGADAVRWLALALALIAAPACAALSPAELSSVGATPPKGARLPVGLDFVDQVGRRYRLGEAPVPTMLLFADYSCRHICGPGITLTAGALHDAGLRPGRDYRMLTIGLDGDGPAIARRIAVERLRGLPDEARAMTLLTGTPRAIAAAEAALGYHAAYDRQADQFAHDAALYVFAPDGALSALLPETAATPAQLARALADARAGALYTPPAPAPDESLAGRITAICYGLAAAHGVYAGPIVLALRGGAVALCLGFAGFLLVMRRRKTA